MSGQIKTKNCCEVFQCTKTECPAYRSANRACWLISGTCCKDDIQGKFIDKIEMCIDCVVFEKNIATTSLKETFTLTRKQINEYQKQVEIRDNELEKLSMEMAIGMTEVFEALKKISSGHPPVLLDETSDIEILRDLKRLVNETSFSNSAHIEEFHEIAIGLAEHFDVLQKITQGDLNARVSGNSTDELLILLKGITNSMIDSIQIEIETRKKIEETLKENEERYKILFNNVSDAVFVQEISSDVYTPGRFIEVNGVACRYLGYSREELLQMSVPRIDAPETLANFPIILKRLFAEEHTIWEGVHVSKDGRRIPVEISNQLFNLHGKPMILSTARDITERKQAEEELNRLKKHLDMILQSAGEGILGLDLEGNQTFVNPSAAEKLGYKVEELIGQSSHAIWHYSKEDGNPYPEDECPITATYKDGTIHSGDDEVFWRKDGTSFPVRYTSTPILEHNKLTGAVVVFRDITDRKEHEIRFAKSLKEKEMLLKELHHRVKNNLQILSSLISFQIKDDNEARVNQILTECKDRVKTIAIIHDKLYQSEDMTSIEVRKLISDIANSLVYSLRDIGSQIDLILNIQDISIGIDIAIPLGLIVNEIVSNSVKHAFPSKMKGEVCIDFHAMNGEFVLNVHDNGIGLPEDFNTEKSDSLGMYLIYTLAEQLNGRAEFIRNNGTTVKIHFKK